MTTKQETILVLRKKRSKMLRIKKKILPILLFLSVLATSCLLCFTLPGEKAHADSEPIKDVSYIDFTLFNSLSENSTNVEMGMGKFGMLVRFDDVLSDDISEINGGIKNVNLIEEYGKNIKINNLPLDFYTDAEVCYYCEDYLWIFINNINNYRIISVDEEFRFLDRMIQPFALYSYYEYGPGWTDDAAKYISTKTYDVELVTDKESGYKV